MILIVLFFTFSFSFESRDVLNAINGELNWNLYEEYENKKFVYQSNEILDGVIVTKIEQKVNYKAKDIIDIILNINQYNTIISNKNIASSLDSSINDTIYAYQKITNMIPFVRDRQYVFKMYKVNENKINWYILDEKNSIVEKYVDESINTLIYGAGSWEVLNENILVNKIYVNDEVNMPYKFINRIRIKSVVNIFDDILKILEN
tara:strand:+ start:870 stop:1484 length:615 start_codon:yes stop_codon:yes gene_type:complete